ncbi:MAG: hypothetical protein GY820_45710 [Gammaproteobacteria bacterium]|nr:hypothetical protein [Gammaproteobacteria bacterium]
MQDMQVTLPGGLSQNGRIERQATFHLLTGRIEQTLIDSSEATDRPAYVTRALGATLEKIGNQSVDSAQVEALCVADRQYLMLRLAALLDGEQKWLKFQCASCEALFDVDFLRCDLPVKEAGQDYPSSTLRLNGVEVILRVPTGGDQQQIGKLGDEQAFRILLQQCICSVDGEPVDKVFIDELGDAEIEAIDNVLDELSPAVCNQLLVTCPECKKQQNAALDHYQLNATNSFYFHDEVHTLASHYHWSEAEILDLPQSRRRLYLDMINRSVGISGQG